MSGLSEKVKVFSISPTWEAIEHLEFVLNSIKIPCKLNVELL